MKVSAYIITRVRNVSLTLKVCFFFSRNCTLFLVSHSTVGSCQQACLCPVSLSTVILLIISFVTVSIYMYFISVLDSKYRIVLILFSLIYDQLSSERLIIWDILDTSLVNFYVGFCFMHLASQCSCM